MKRELRISNPKLVNLAKLNGIGERRAWGKRANGTNRIGTFVSADELERLNALRTEQVKRAKPGEWRAQIEREIAGSTSTERTIHLGQHSSHYGRICVDLGIGKHVPPPTNHRISAQVGWFVSPVEMRAIFDEADRRATDRSCSRVVASTPVYRAQERTEEAWRDECADPYSVRTPEEAWTYAVRLYMGIEDADRMPPMPLDPPPRQRRDIERYCRRSCYGAELGTAS